MPNLCNKPAARQTLEKVIAAKITAQKMIIKTMVQNRPVMMIAAHHVLHVSLI
ncbi:MULTISPECIES: hypothetical protein [Chryseobacterium]|uniref:hypothetical protein n=1 Tax=Chryseobacterium TaxID=59732 RepID=UPI000AC3E1C2|nr:MULTISPECIES: hypothetical protein [Chryseobacterium]MCL8536367.1 hypothetical protein [Chryseobacterium gallinarum]